MISNGDFKGPGAFKVACNIILQLNNFLIFRVRFKAYFCSQEYRIITIILWLMKVKRLRVCAILSEQSGWLPIRCAYFILYTLC